MVNNNMWKEWLDVKMFEKFMSFWQNVQAMVITRKFVLSSINCGLHNSKPHVNFMTR